MIKIGITGGIGSGKSYVAHLLEKKGIPLYDTDREAKRLTVTHPQIREKLSDLLGAEVYHTDGTLNKPLVAGYLFSSPEHAEHINQIVHPCVYDDFQLWADRQAEAGAEGICSFGFAHKAGHASRFSIRRADKSTHCRADGRRGKEKKSRLCSL